MNLVSALILAVVTVAFIAAVVRVVRNRKSDRCSACSFHDCCVRNSSSCGKSDR
ncbi:MAG: hypothetical protein MJY53_04960 [Bacteroidales bacterium]|nr:hypothetical protein [Bacteroidales bacterium]